MQYNLPMPPTLQGSEAQQLVQLHRYLFRMNDMLSQALASESVTIQGLVEQQQHTVSTDKLSQELSNQYNQAKSFIIKTADIVRSEMAVIKATLEDNFVAYSAWGDYKESVSNEITVTATGIVQNYDYSGIIDNAVGTDFKTFKTQLNGSIRSGIIDTSEDGTPIIGIAIAQDLKATEVDGKVHIVKNQNMATYTSDRVSFWQNGVVVAYISQSTLVITNARLHGKLEFSDKWEISHTRGFTIKWIGGED